MRDASAPPLAPDGNTARRVLREQVAALYATSWSSTVADTALAWGLCALFYWQLRDPWILVWLGLHLIQVLRYPLIGAYFRDPQAAERSDFWARRQWRELLYYSSTWGLAPWLFLPDDNLPLTTLMMLLMLGLCSGGVPSVAPRWASVLAFTLPMMAGLIGALLWHGGTTHLFLAACTAVHLGATLHFAHAQHRLLTAALHTRFEKEALAEELARQMQATQRISEEKTRFFAPASHDLRQPLHAIALFGAVLEKDLQAHASLPHVQRLRAAVDALGHSLDGMLDVSQLDAGTVRPAPRDLALNGLLLALHPLLAPHAEERALELRLRTTPLWVHSDPELLQRMLANLIENAIKYTPTGGVLVVARPRGREVWIDVVDTGLGIAPEHCERVFDEFYQVDNPGRDRTRGLGMGLSIVRRLSQLLAHPVTVRSRPGRGSRFRVQLPMADAPAPAALPDPVALDVPTRPLPQRVLLVDDEVDITDALGAFLQRFGVACTAVANEADAALHLQQAAAHGLPFDALLCDYRLAEGADGLAAALRLRARFAPGLPLLLVTGETAPARLQRVHEARVPVLFKPVRAEHLLDALARLGAPVPGQPPGA